MYEFGVLLLHHFCNVIEAKFENEKKHEKTNSSTSKKKKQTRAEKK